MIQNDCMIAGAKPGGSDSERFVDNGFLCKYTRLYSLFFFFFFTRDMDGRKRR